MVRKIEYTVSESGIAPAITQFGGVQGEHRATELAFGIENTLWIKLNGLVASEGGELIYRFDGYDGEGGVHRSDTASLTESVSYLLEEQLTRYGGTVRVVLVVSLVKSDTTEMELYSFPAVLKLKGLPMGSESEDENHESMSTLAKIAKTAAEQTEQDRDFVEAAEKRVAENLVGYIPLNASLEIIFDGGDSAGGIDSIVVPDSEMSDTSENTVKNRVAKAYVDKKVDEVVEKVDEASAKAISDSHPIGSVYYSIDEQDPGELFGGTWEKVRSFYGGELIAYGRIQNTVSNTTAVTAGNVIVISDKCVPEKQYNTVNLIDGIITVDSGTFKIYTQGIAGLVEAQMIVSGRSETDCAGIWWSGNANEIPNGVEMWPNTETNQPLCHIPSNSYGSGMNTYLYHIKDTAADGTNFFVNPCCKAYAGSFTPCAGGTASALIVKVFAKSGITHSWKRTA